MQLQSVACWAALVLFVLISRLHAANTADMPPVVRVPPATKAPTIDGKIDAAEWNTAFQGCGVIRATHGTHVLEMRKARYWFTYDNERIYIAMQTELPPWGKLLGKRRRQPIDAGHDDSIEIFINPGRPVGSVPNYYQLLGNFVGSMCNFVHNPNVSGSAAFNGDVRFENSTADGWWTSEISVRADDLHHANIQDGPTWGINFTRFWVSGSTNYSAWPSVVYLRRENYAQITIDKNAPVVQLLDLKEPHGGKPGFTFSLLNPGTQEIELTVHMKVSDGSAGAKVVEETKRVKIAAGAREKVEWQTDWSLGDSATSNMLSAEVSSGEGAIKYFTTSIPFDRDNGRKETWVAPPVSKQVGAIDMTASFYPGFSRLRCQVNFAALKLASMVNKATVVVTDAAGKQIAQADSEKFVDGEGEIVVQLPKPLAEGKYTATLNLSAGAKPIGEPVQKSFEKKNFEFENNTIGISDRVLSPWTPMKVSGRTVSCWNRDVTVGENGFFEQLKSGRYELLNRPVALDARSEGKSLPWRADGVKVTSAKDSAVDFTASSSCDKIQVDVACHSEFDGMFKYELTLKPRGDGKVDGLDLVVPMKQEYAWLLHACSDGTRTNASLFTPSGEGRVWDSTGVMQFRLTGTFIPYLWLGDDRAGLCWWADSERGWVRPADRKSPAIEVRRAKGEVQMVFHLIARPFQLTEPRTIVFAFNASPVRPRPSWARSWTNVTTKQEGYLKGPHLRVDGSANWVSFGKDTLPDRSYAYGSLRPISDEAEKWLKDYAAQRHASGQTLVVYTDIYVRTVCRGDEVKHYAAEWDRCNNAHPQEETQSWRSDTSVGLTNMTPSRIDYDLWCLKNGVELGIDGYYFDEIMTVGQINPTADLGFVDESGNWEAEGSLFALRTYFKRLYTMLQEKGHLEPFIMPHDSSDLYAGPLAFATIPMDLEMTSADPDQNRGQVFGIGEPYAMCNVMAFQHGLVGSGMYCAPNSHVADLPQSRTFLGSMLLFDAHAVFGPTRAEGALVDHALGVFGYDQPGVEYVPYWRATDLQTTGPDRVHVSLFRNNDKALLVMYNDNPNPVAATWKPTAKFAFQGDSLGLLNVKEIQPAPTPVKSMKSDGTWEVEIPPYDYRLGLVSTSGVWGAQDAWGEVDPKLFERNLKPAARP